MSTAAAQFSAKIDNVSKNLATPVVDMAVPYIHQELDTLDNFTHGGAACGSTSAVMALAYFTKLTAHKITISQGGSHTNDFGYYVSHKYTSSIGKTFPSGAWGATTIENASWMYKIANYLIDHGLPKNKVEQVWPYPTSNFDVVKNNLDKGYLIIMATRLTGAGHIVLVRGYTNDNRLIVNDPWGNKNSTGYGRSRNGAGVQYTFQQMKPKWMIVVKGNTEIGDHLPLITDQPLNSAISPNNDTDYYEFAGIAGTSVRLTMTKTSGTLDSYMELYNPDKGLLAYNDDSNGTHDSQIDATLPVDGTYRVVTHSYNHLTSGAYQLKLTSVASDSDDFRWITIGDSLHGTLNTNNDKDTYYIYGTTNVVISLRMIRDLAPLDSYLELYSPTGVKVAQNDDGGGNYNAWLVYRFATSGTYRLVARSYNSATNGGYTISANSARGVNYALNKPVTATSREASTYLASYATDGDRTTRWSSGSNLNQSIYVDLGQTVAASQVVIRWETARATNYGIYYFNGSTWTLLRSVSNGAGDVDVLGFTTINTRYIMLSMWDRSDEWNNYSLWEFEVYDAIGALVPTVPPDEPKDPETDTTPLIPLPSVPDGKDTPILALPSEQEIEPLPDSGLPGPLPTISLTNTYGLPTASLDLSGLTIQPGSMITGNALNAHDTDNTQVGSGIIGYRWSMVTAEPGETGSVVNLISDQASVVIFANDWFPGTYIVSLEVQDDEGCWSEPIIATIQIPSGIYLPLIIRN